MAEVDRPKAWQKVEQVMLDEGGKVVGRKPFPLTICEKGAGYALECYRPKKPKDAVAEVVQLSCGVSLEKSSSAVAESRNYVTKKDSKFAVKHDTARGLPSFEWSELPPCSQKPVEMEKFDPASKLFPCGAHMPIVVFMGAASRRSAGARARRDKRADERGWTYERRYPHRSTVGGRGGSQPAASWGSQPAANSGKPAARWENHGGGWVVGGWNTRDGGGWEGWAPDSWKARGKGLWRAR